ncbi:hypothetical protein D3C71_1902950 [compost metagenome]
MTSSTGNAVHTVALSTDSQMTGIATCAAASGRTSRNCTMQNRQAKLVASPTRRSAPMRCTNCALYTR